MILFDLYHRIAAMLARSADAILPTLVRFVFGATLLLYYWGSAMTKTGPGILGVFHPTSGGYAQIFPKVFEAANYNTDNLNLFHWAVTVGGSLAEWVLPTLIVLGLFTRLAALGMIGFIGVQTLTDLYGHGAIKFAETVGGWFDRDPGSVILDQRLFWVTILIVLVVKGGGPLSLDRVLRNGPWARPVSRLQ